MLTQMKRQLFPSYRALMLFLIPAAIALVMLFVALLPALAHAQEAVDAGQVIAAPSTVLSTVTKPAADLTDPGTLAAVVLGAVANKQWSVVICGGVLLLIGAARRFIPEATRVGTAFHSKVGGWILNFATTLALTLLGAFIAGQQPSLGLVLGALTTGLATAGALELFHDMFPAKVVDAAPAVAAGVAAAADPGKTLGQ